jgi:hypothetical protein
MLHNRIPEAESAPAASSAGDRPQLRIAARTEPDASQESAVDVIGAELSSWHGHWRRTLESMKASLADLEQACGSAIDAREAEVAGVIERIVDRAAAQADAAAAQTREQAQVEITGLQARVTELQKAVESLQRDLDAEREGVKSIESRLEESLAERQRIETERDEARRELERQATAADSRIEALRSERDAVKGELSSLRQQHEVAASERSKLSAALQAVQQALSHSISAATAPSNEGETPQAPAPMSAVPDAPIELEEKSETLAHEPAPQPEPPAAGAEVDPQVVEDIKRVLDQVEAIYQLDLNAGRSGTELVDSLTGSLRYARSLIVARWHRDDCDAEKVFDAQIAAVLDLSAGSSFGRHLSIAACDLRKPASPAQKDSASEPGIIS